jgi:hypothetical protein
MSFLSADMRLLKRSQDFNSPVCSQKRICVTPDRGEIASPHHALTSLQSRLPMNVSSGPSSDDEPFSEEPQDVNMSDDSLQALAFANSSPLNVGDEIVDREAEICEICYGAVRTLNQASSANIIH